MIPQHAVAATFARRTRCRTIAGCRWSRRTRFASTSDTIIEIARAASEAEALEGLERWKQRHSAAWEMLEPADVLVDAMRGRSATWTRIRLNLQHVPEELRPAQEPIEPSARSLSGW